MKSKYLSIFLLGLILGIFSTAYGARAEAPVVDLSRGQQESLGLEIDDNRQSEPMDQRLLKLERQIANLNDMNYASKLEKVQQELQQLRGQMEVQTHDLTQLKEQVKNFYQDLDQRLTKKTTAVAAATGIAAAFNQLNKKQYEKAISGFQAFIKAYPSNAYTVNAHYWLGEIYYLKDKPELASKEFQAIVANYPENPKVADAMLKLALIAMDAGNYTKARQHLGKVQHQFTGSTAAKIATLRLKEIKQKK
jgi:tol-pal system protein YbgF